MNNRQSQHGTRDAFGRQPRHSFSVRMLAAVTAIGIAVNAAAHDRTPTDKLQASSAKVRHWLEIGQASWYGLKFQGHKTATGEKYDKNSLTCAHRSLPLGSWIRVTNLRNRKSVFVRVNDRGPMLGNRVVDLSQAAAQLLGLSGIGHVKVEAVTPGDADMAKALVAQLQTSEISGLSR